MSIEDFINSFIISFFNITNEEISGAISYFIYDTIKILLFLFIMISIVGILRTYLPTYRIKQALSGKREGVGNIFASMFGAITPFCSCSSIPIFFSMLDAGVPLGVTFSFLITSPIVNEYVAVIMLSVFGLKITLYYIAAGIIIGVIGGIIMGRMNLEKYIETDFISKDNKQNEKKYTKFKERLDFGIKEGKDIVRKVWIYVVVGIGLAAAVHGFVPDEFFHKIVEMGGIFAVPLAVLFGVPLYANCAAVVPIAAVLVAKGVPLGTALAFLMGTAALSFPEAVILRRAMKLKLIGIFFGIVALAIIFIGYLFNVIV